MRRPHSTAGTACRGCAPAPAEQLPNAGATRLRRGRQRPRRIGREARSAGLTRQPEIDWRGRLQ
ncbi:hypothetical protein WS45_08940 [Burkholderia sp. RF2-non_BP3]|nr:hypothetical protein WS45_08940 [Burkholderia sp. RF2-non_BP3]